MVIYQWSTVLHHQKNTRLKMFLKFSDNCFISRMTNSTKFVAADDVPDYINIHET